MSCVIRATTPTFKYRFATVNVTIPSGATVAVYGRSRSGYYIYAPQLTIVEA